MLVALMWHWLTTSVALAYHWRGTGVALAWYLGTQACLGARQSAKPTAHSKIHTEALTHRRIQRDPWYALTCTDVALAYH